MTSRRLHVIPVHHIFLSLFECTLKDTLTVNNGDIFVINTLSKTRILDLYPRQQAFLTFSYRSPPPPPPRVSNIHHLRGHFTVNSCLALNCFILQISTDRLFSQRRLECLEVKVTLTQNIFSTKTNLDTFSKHIAPLGNFL